MADGRPRFKLVKTRSSYNDVINEILLLDRAYCHRVVASFNLEGRNRRNEEKAFRQYMEEFTGSDGTHPEA